MIQYLKVRPLPDELETWRRRIEKIATGLGLDFFETRFEMVSYDKMSEIAAYGGFPTRDIPIGDLEWNTSVYRSRTPMGCLRSTNS